jgi:hypothetical protein
MELVNWLFTDPCKLILNNNNNNNNNNYESFIMKDHELIQEIKDTFLLQQGVPAMCHVLMAMQS